MANESDKNAQFTPAALAAAANGDWENFIAASTPGGIERQEKQGQERFVVSETLPLQFNSGKREELEGMGIRYGDPVDDLFANVTLPQGWKKVPTDHSMWSHLIDDKGRERASIFYKAAFYDRDAFVNVNPRFRVSSYLSCDAEGQPVSGDGTHLATVVEDGGKPIQTFGIRSAAHTPEMRAIREQHNADAYAWLNEHYPQWESNTAYWD